MVVFHSADQVPDKPHLFAKAVGICPLYWQVESEPIYPITSISPLSQTLWDSQGGHCWIMAEDDFMGYNEGPDGSHIYKFFLIAETTLTPGDRVFVTFPDIQIQLPGAVVFVEDGFVTVQADSGAIVTDVRDRVRKLR